MLNFQVAKLQFWDNLCGIVINRIVGVYPTHNEDIPDTYQQKDDHFIATFTTTDPQNH